MSYIPAGMSQEDYFERELALREREVIATEKSVPKKTFWRDAGYFVSAVVPIMTFFGIKEYFAYKRRRKATRRKQ
jgi:hypothetical protein